MSTAKIPGYEKRALAPPVLRHNDDHCSHVVQFYDDDSFLIESLSQCVADALMAGDAAIIVATQSHRDRLARRLESRHVNLSSAVEKGRYVEFDAFETLDKLMFKGRPDETIFQNLVGGLITSARKATGRENSRVLVFGEMVALLTEAGREEAAIELEQLWNRLAESHSFSLRCAYPMSSFTRDEGASILTKVCSEHSAVIPAESYAQLQDEDDRLRGIVELQRKLQVEKLERQELEKSLRAREAELERMVERRTAALRRLSVRVLGLQDAERRRIARELHDGFGQYLTALKIDLGMLRSRPESADLWAEADELLGQCISEIRTLSYLLHPPMIEESGLASAAGWYVQGFGERSGIEVSLEISPSELDRLPGNIELALFRILQEALGNVHRHSNADAADIRILRNAETVMLEVRDNGKGITEDTVRRFNETGTSSGVGLTGMYERAREIGGELRLESNGSGTAVVVVVPIA